MRFSIIPFLLLVVPIAEISAFVVIGGKIGLAATLGLILVTAVIGSVLLRWQGLGLLARISAEMQAGRVPGRDLVHGVMILVAGVLLLVPGFVTDTLGFLLFIPPVREAAWRFLKSRVTIVPAGPIFSDPRGGRGREPGGRGPVVDLDERDFRRSDPGKSPWSSGANDLPSPGSQPGKRRPDSEDGL